MLNRPCNQCGSRYTITLTSVDKIMCADCRTYSPFKLKAGQQSVLIEGKIGECSIDDTGKKS